MTRHIMCRSLSALECLLTTPNNRVGQVVSSLRLSITWTASADGLGGHGFSSLKDFLPFSSPVFPPGLFKTFQSQPHFCQKPNVCAEHTTVSHERLLGCRNLRR